MVITFSVVITFSGDTNVSKTHFTRAAFYREATDFLPVSTCWAAQIATHELIFVGRGSPGKIDLFCHLELLLCSHVIKYSLFYWSLQLLLPDKLSGTAADEPTSSLTFDFIRSTPILSCLVGNITHEARANILSAMKKVGAPNKKLARV